MRTVVVRSGVLNLVVVVQAAVPLVLLFSDVRVLGGLELFCGAGEKGHTRHDLGVEGGLLVLVTPSRHHSVPVWFP